MDSWEAMHELRGEDRPNWQVHSDGTYSTTASTASTAPARDGIVLPHWDVATLKMYHAWYAYELVLKCVDRLKYSICRWCGILPPKTGSDACAKVCINLNSKDARRQLDYAPQSSSELLPQEDFFSICAKGLLNKIMWGAQCTTPAPIPVDRVPPILFNGAYASHTLINTEKEKRRAAAEAVGGSGPAPTTEALAPVAQLVCSGQLDIAKLRSSGESISNTWLDDMLGKCKCPPNVQSKMGTTKAKKIAWLLTTYDSVVAGTSDCHMHFQWARGTGGACTLSCPHGVVVIYKFLFSAETNRDHADLLRSLLMFPAVHWLDDACGLMTHMQGTYTDEFKELYGINRGCPKPWQKDPSDDYLAAVQIPEVATNAHKRTARCPERRKYAKGIIDAKGDKRLHVHPFLYNHRWRLALTDRFHATIHKKTHKRKACALQLASGVSSLTHERSNVMESLNARLKEHLTTVCTAGPDHSIPFLDRIIYWENAAIIEKQDVVCKAACPKGHSVAADPVFRFSHYVCKNVGGDDARCDCDDEVAERGPTNA
jgi:hypothetical protein